jgi:histidine triad (HIT) family protein
VETPATDGPAGEENRVQRTEGPLPGAFCEIVRGEGHVDGVAVVRTVAFPGILPVVEGHALVALAIPRRQALGLVDLREEEGTEMFAARRAAGLAEAVDRFLAAGEDAGEEVLHAHLHVVAGRVGDGMSLGVDHPPAPSRPHLDRTAGHPASVPGNEA